MIVGLAFGRFLVCIFLCPGCGLVIGFVCFLRAAGFCLAVLLVVHVFGCWGFDWLFVLVVPVCG